MLEPRRRRPSPTAASSPSRRRASTSGAKRSATSGARSWSGASRRAAAGPALRRRRLGLTPWCPRVRRCPAGVLTGPPPRPGPPWRATRTRGDAGERADAPADPGGRVVALRHSWPGSQPRRLRRGPGWARSCGLGGTRLQPSGREPPRRRRASSTITAAGPRRPRAAGLPGVGPYTARAVLAFAFERDVAVVDTNVARVLARAGGGCLTRAEVQGRADAGARPGLGPGTRPCSTWGRPSARRGPRCGRCPLAAAAGGAGRAARPGPGAGGAVVRRVPFEGSDRQGRGRLVEALRPGPSRRRMARAAGWPDDAPGPAGWRISWCPTGWPA